MKCPKSRSFFVSHPGQHTVKCEHISLPRDTLRRDRCLRIHTRYRYRNRHSPHISHDLASTVIKSNSFRPSTCHTVAWNCLRMRDCVPVWRRLHVHVHVTCTVYMCQCITTCYSRDTGSLAAGNPSGSRLCGM